LTGNEASPTNRKKTRVIAFSCNIKISAVHHLLLSQYTRLVDGLTDGQNCDSNTVRCITCSRMEKLLSGLNLRLIARHLHIIMWTNCCKDEFCLQVWGLAHGERRSASLYWESGGCAPSEFQRQSPCRNQGIKSPETDSKNIYF